jgi:GalNAc-alpha-(1->4)-GalNAc-alpha-(1->3)-diNAcBac-PP-undecaprenol alpha-1,4-N-acetyl-D-galactosaminyltransferase
MKILLVIPSLTSGGAERVISDMANYWAGKGFSVSLITLNPWLIDFYTLDKNVNRIIFDDSKPQNGIINKIHFNVSRIFHLRKVLKIHNPDVVLSFLDVTNITTILASLGLNNKVVVSERINPETNPVLNSFWFYLRKLLYKRADIVVAQTMSASTWLDKNCSICSHIIPNPVRKLKKYNVTRINRIISIGRLDKQKGHDVLIKSFSKIEKNYPDWSVDIYGEGPEKNELNILIAELNLQAKIFLKGETHDVENVLSEAGMFVLASRFEGFPNVLLEAMSLGCPVISTNCKSGPSEIITNNENGFLIDVDDELQLADKISFLIENPIQCTEIGNNASKINHIYSQENIMDQWDSLMFKNVTKN